ncbi:MAG: cell division protein FtsA [Sphaerochaetaceae bacterium]|nr:cell division protein FtsA [Sphaerochaetaceae bacterium]
MPADKMLMTLDLGTSKVRAVIGSIARESGALTIESISERPSEGISHGAIVNVEQALKTITATIHDAELQAGCEIDSVITGVGGKSIMGTQSQGVVGIRNSDLEIKNEDIKHSVDVACAINMSSDRTILHSLVQNFIVDGVPSIKNPKGMIGHRLETEVLVITASAQSLQNERKTLQRAGYTVDRMILSSLADAEIVLSAEEKEVGAIVINIGRDVTNMIAYSNGTPCFTGGIDLGGFNITSDIAFILGKPASVAEQIKCEKGYCYTPSVSHDQILTIPAVSGLAPIQMPLSELSKIIEPRMAEIFSILKSELDRVNPQSNWGSGVILVGGGALLSGVTELASEIFRCPARIGFPEALKGLDRNYIDPRYTTVLGLMKNEAARLAQKPAGRSSGSASAKRANPFKALASMFKKNF